MRHSYYPPLDLRHRWRLSRALPGQRIFMAIWAWM